MNITKEIQTKLIHTLKMKKLLGAEYVRNMNFSYKRNENITLPNTIVELEEYVKNCSLCELSKTKKVSLFANGNIFSKVYIIGLNYNYNNEKEFILIKNMIEKVMEISIENIYMTNILKCNSTKLDNNYEKEVNTCISYLQQQISLGLPKIIITLGNAFEYLIKSKEQIFDVSGNLFSYNGIDLIPLMDPNFIYKNPSYKEKMFKDLKKIKNIMEEK